MDLLDVIDGIENGTYSPDGLAAVIPEMVRMHHRQLPELVAYVINKGLWRRWGFADPWTYFNAIGVPDRVFQQVAVIMMECLASVAQHKAGRCAAV
jgi:hypothetical protein